MDVKSVLESLVYAGRKAHQINIGMRDLGYDNTPYLDIYSGIADAIYIILGETCDFEVSATATFLADQNTMDDQCADGLFSVYMQRNADPELSDSTMEVLKSEAAKKGIPLQSMINLIAAEWVLRNQITKHICKAI